MARSRKTGCASCSAAVISASVDPLLNAFSMSIVLKVSSMRLRRLPAQQLVLEREAGLGCGQLEDVQLLDHAVGMSVVGVHQRDDALPAGHRKDGALPGARLAQERAQGIGKARLVEGDGAHLAVVEAVGERVARGER